MGGSEKKQTLAKCRKCALKRDGALIVGGGKKKGKMGGGGGLQGGWLVVGGCCVRETPQSHDKLFQTAFTYFWHISVIFLR